MWISGLSLGNAEGTIIVGASFSLNNPRVVNVKRHCFPDFHCGSYVWYTGQARARLTAHVGLKLFGVGIGYDVSTEVTDEINTDVLHCQKPCQ